MIKLIKIMINSCRGNGYLMIGLCLGLSLSLFMSPVEIPDGFENNQPIDEQTWITPLPQEAPDDYIPKLNLETKPRRAQKVPKTLVRPRYYSTELGIRERLFVAVSTSREHLHSRATSLNKTLAHLVDKIRYFITIPEGAKPNVTLPGIVGFTDTRRLLKPFHIIKYITDNYLEEYDYYFLIGDTSYVNAHALNQLINAISVSRDVYLGAPSTEDPNYCSFTSGILLSNSIIKKLKNNLDWCVKNTFSNFEEINFGRCIEHSMNLKCSRSIDNVEYKSLKKLLKKHFEKSSKKGGKIFQNFEKNIISVTNEDFYETHINFAVNRINEINEIIKAIEDNYTTSLNELNSNNSLFKKSWPIGNELSSRTTGRFDLIRWNYFNATHTLMETDHENARELIGSLRSEISEVISAITEKLRLNNLRFVGLANGWRRFNAARGIDYIVDVSASDFEGRIQLKRLEICKLLGKAEVLPVPYVTENSRINLVLMVESPGISGAIGFMEEYGRVCMEKRDKTSLMLVLIYAGDAPSKGENDFYQEVKRKAQELSDRHKKEQRITWLSIRMAKGLAAGEGLARVGIADLVVRKFTPESLVLFTEIGVEIKAEWLNRVRMNTIMQYQIFSPIPFTEYHPDIAYTDDTRKQREIDINRNYGSYDNFNYNSISFYVKDYQNLRKLTDKHIPIVRNDKDMEKMFKLRNNSIDSIFELFVNYSELHSLRAIEPGLKIRYSEINCDYLKLFGESTRINCETRKLMRLGHRGQLAKLILDYQSSS